MPVEVGTFTTEVTVADGDLPLSGAQLEQLVRLVLRRVEEKQRAEKQTHDASAVRASAAPRPRTG
jgi:hypothetical protein